VDDEPAIRGFLNFGLRLGGFQVWHATNGEDAVAVYQENPSSIKLVLLDMRMPGVDGAGTLAALRRINPAVRCCIITGHACESTQTSLLRMGALHVFQKPIFSILGFVQQIRQLAI
jgi:two-component system OmpR family response regulator